MGLREMMASSKAAAPKAKTSKDEPHLHIIDMSRKKFTNQNGEEVPSNQGTVKFLPIVSLSGVETKYAYEVKCCQMEDDEGYRRTIRFMDPKDYVSQLTDDQKALLLRCRSMVDSLIEDGWEFPWVDKKNYGMMFGYILEHTSVDGTVISDIKSRKTALLIFPSKNFAKAVNQLTKDLLGYGDEVADEMYGDLFSRNLERSYYLTVNFNKSEAGFGYECTMSADSIDRKCIKIATPEEIKEGKIAIPQSEMDFTTEHTAVFIAGDREGSEDFDEATVQAALDYMIEWTDQAEKEAKAAEDIPPIPNKNGKKGKKSDLDEE
jgi:hypothetical protein